MTRFAPCLLAVAALLASPALAPAQKPTTPLLAGNGFEIFQAVLDLAKLTPVTNREIADARRYDDMIVVVMGDPRVNFGNLFPPLSVVDRVIGGGGAALVVFNDSVALNFGRGNNVTQIDGRRVAVTRPELAYQGQLLSPLVQPVPENDPDLFGGLTRVATEHPSFVNQLQFRNGTRRAIARFPIDHSVFQGTNVPIDVEAYPFAVADLPMPRNGRLEYRLVVMADHAVFQNSLMAPPATAGQTDNILLAQRTVEYLQGPDKSRKRCAYYENGLLVEDFGTVRRMMQTQGDMPNLPNPLALLLANQPAITDIGNGLLDNVQKQDVFGSLGERLATGLPYFLVAAAVYASWFLLRRVWRLRQSTETLPPPYPGGSVTADRSGGVFDRRKRELVRRNNLYEPVRDALRDLFNTAGGNGGPGVKPPPIECSNEVRRPAKLRDAVHELWRLAYGRPVVVSVRRSQELAPVIERLSREHAQGAWWFSGTRSEA